MKYFRLTAFFLLMLLIAAGCTDGGAGIFYSIEKEEKIANKSLSDFLSAERGVFLPTYSPADNTMFVAAGTLYTLDADTPDQDWSKVSLPGSWYYTWQIAGDGAGTLFAVLESRDGDAAALYSFDGAWSAPASGFIGRPVSVWYEGSTLFLMTAQEQSGGEYFAYRLYSGADIGSLAALPIDLSGAGFGYDAGGGDWFTITPFRDIAWNGSQFWYITAAGIYQGTAGAISTDTTSAPSVSQFRRLHYLTSTTLADGMYVSTTANSDGDGFVYRYDGAWSGAMSAGSDPNDFAVVNFSGTEYLLLGTKNGYLESTTGDSFSGESATIDSNYDNTGLDDTVINGFFDSTVPGTGFYAMTSGYGLWRNTGGSWDLE